MKADLTIERVDVTPADIPLTDEFVISSGRVAVAENAFVCVHLRCGAKGCGEIAPFPALTGETRKDSVAAARALIPDLVGTNAADLPSVSEVLAEHAGSAPAVRAAIECALVDAHARALHVPLWKHWGARGVNVYETDITLPILDEDRIDALCDQWYGRGFRTFKLKVGDNPDVDARRVRRLAARHPDIAFVLDANQGFDAHEARVFVDALSGIRSRITVLEQPVPRDDVESMAALRRDTGVRIAADESVFTVADARRVIDERAVDVINLKIMKSGLWETIDIAALARERRVELMIGGMVESRLAMSFSLALALGLGGITHFDLDTPLLLASDPIRGGYRYDGPRMLLWHTHGVGGVPRTGHG